MSANVCRAAAIALVGLEGTAVQVEAAASSQLPGMAIIGLPDAALAEAKQRVRTATQQSGLSLSDRLLIINLSPADLPKHGSGFDLAIALSALAASGQLPANGLADTAHLGELGLGGELRRPQGLLSALLAARGLGFARAMVPASCEREAALVPDIEVIAADDLRGAVAWHKGETEGWRIARATQPAITTLDRASVSESGPAELSAADLRTRAGANEASADAMRADTAHADTAPDMRDVIGQEEAVEAFVVAAAGRHHVSMIGPPGAGKTLLATRLVSILPDLEPHESIMASSIASLGGATLTELVRRPPFESPHHSITRAALVGGGDSRGVSLGAVTRACYGVLFLDELGTGKYTS